MTIEINIPDIGESEVEVTEILVKVGDKVKKDQSLISVEGDKASIEIPSPQSGVVKEIKVFVGEKVNTGKLIMIFDSIKNEENISSIKKEKKEIAIFSNSLEKKVHVPDIGNESFEVTDILVKVGETIVIGQSLISIKCDTTSMEVPSPIFGKIKEIKINIGEKITTGSLIMICKIEEERNEKGLLNQAVTLFSEEKEREIMFSDNITYFHATPSIRRLIREFGINIKNVKGTGRKGRILLSDVQAYIKNIVKNSNSMEPCLPTNNFIDSLLPWPKVDFGKFGNVEEMKLSRIQKISGENLKRNWIMIPHVTHFDKADITELEEFRKQQNSENEKYQPGLKITLVIFIMKAVSVALEKMPIFNGSLSEDKQSIVLKKYINIGIAVDTTSGLLVPVIKDVNKKGIIKLTHELMSITQKARNGSLTTEEMKGGCFTISSIGNLGTTHFSPIINAPEAAILGISKSSIEPFWNKKEFIPRLMLPLSLSFDHRIIDGANGARFLTIIKNILCDIRRLVM